MTTNSLLEYVEAYAVRAFEELSEKQFQQALRTVDKALAIDPCSELALMLRSDVWMATAHPRLAIRDLDSLLHEHPDCIAAYFKRAEARLAMGHWAAAVRNCTEILSREPQNTSALHLRAVVQVDKRRVTKALDDLDRLLKIDPDHPEARIDRGYVRFMLGDLNGSKGDLEAALEMRKADEPSLESAGRLLRHVLRIQKECMRRTG